MNYIPLWWRIAIATNMVGLSAWWLNTLLNPPHCTRPSLMLFAVASACKVCNILLVPVSMVGMGKLLYRNMATIRRCTLLWSLGFLVLIGILWSCHDAIASFINSDAVRLYYVNNSGASNLFHFVGQAEWLTRWHSGEIILLEVLIGMLSIALCSVWMYFLGKYSYACFVLPPLMFLILFGWTHFFRTIRWDYDVFLTGFFSDVIVVDYGCFILFAWSPVTQIGFAIILLFLASTAVALHPRWRA
jgi:hypothetical protein